MLFQVVWLLVLDFFGPPGWLTGVAILVCEVGLLLWLDDLDPYFGYKATVELLHLAQPRRVERRQSIRIAYSQRHVLGCGFDFTTRVGIRIGVSCPVGSGVP